MIKRIIIYLLAVAVLSGGFILPAYGATSISERDVQLTIMDVDLGKICNNDILSFTLRFKNPEMKSKCFEIGYVVTDSDEEETEQGTFDVTVPAKTVKVHPYSVCLPGYDTYRIDLTVRIEGVVLTRRSAEFSYVRRNTGTDAVIGMNTQINNGWDDDAKTIPQMKDAGFGIIRDSIKWRNADNGDGTYTVPESDMEWIDRANEAGMKVILLAWNTHPDYNDGSLPTSEEDLEELKSYSAQIATQLKGKIWAYEVWNEPCNSSLSTNNYTTTGTQYAAVLKAAYEGIRDVAKDKETLILGGSLTPLWESKTVTTTYLRDMMDAGAGNYMDGFSFHPYSYDSGAYYDEGAIEGDNLDAQVDYARGILAEYDFDKDIYITEVGASTHDNEAAGSVSGVTEQEQAVSLSRVATMADVNEDIEAVVFYTWLEKSSNPAEAAWGIVSLNYGNTKPAYGALSFRNHILGGIENRSKKEQGVYEYSKKNGGSVFALWSEKGESESFSVGTADGIEYSANKISCPADYIVKAYDMYGNEISITGNAITVPEAPVYVSCMPADSADISVEDGIATVSGVLSDKEQPITVMAKEAITRKMIYVNQVYADTEGLYSVEFPIDPNAITTVAVFNGNEKLDRNISNVGMLDVRFYSGGEEVFLADGLPEGDINIKIKTDCSQELIAFAAVSGENEVLLSADSDKAVNNSDADLNVTIEEGAGFKLMIWDMDMKPKIKPVISE